MESVCRSILVFRPSLTWRSCDPLHRLYSHSNLLSGSCFFSTFSTHPSLSESKCTQTFSVSQNHLYGNNIIRLKRYFSTPPIVPKHHSLGQPLFLDEKKLTFKDEQKPRQFLTTDKQTIVCVHPAKPSLHNNTKPLRPLNPALLEQRNSLTAEEVKLVKRLRAMDGALWTLNTLARHFNVKKGVISKVAPASLDRQKELDKEKALTASMKPYKRKLYKAQKQMERQKRLEEIVAKNRERTN